MAVVPLRAGLLLSVGTLTVLRVPFPGRVDGATAAVAMVCAPVAALPLAALAAAVVALGDALGLPPLVVGLLVVGCLALGTRALHWDGLADTADGLASSYDRERSLAVMRTGDVGPAGVLSIVTVAGVQAGSVAALAPQERGWLAVGLLVCASRSVLAPACVRGVPPARADGLGSVHVGSVPVVAALVTGLVGVALAAAATLPLGTGWPGLAGSAVAALVVAALVGRCIRRLGGITGDVLGACVEVCLAVLLVAASAA